MRSSPGRDWRVTPRDRPCRHDARSSKPSPPPSPCSEGEKKAVDREKGVNRLVIGLMVGGRRGWSSWSAA